MGVLGKDSTYGWSLDFTGNAELVSIAALGNLRGALQGGLSVTSNPKLATLDGLEGLEGVGKSDYDRSVFIRDNGALTSIRGLRGLRGLLPGSLFVIDNPVLASFSGLELLTGVAAKDGSGYSLYFESNAVLCLSAPDRARFTDGPRFSLPDAGNSGVTFDQAERTAGCIACPAEAACDGTGNGDATAPCFSVAAADSAACPATSSNTGLIISVVFVVLCGVVVGVCYWQRVACFARAPAAVAAGTGAATAAASDPPVITIKPAATVARP